MEKNKVECSRVNHVIGRAVYPSRSGLGPALVAGDLCSQRVLSWAPSNPAQVAAICGVFRTSVHGGDFRTRVHGISPTQGHSHDFVIRIL